MLLITEFLRSPSALLSVLAMLLALVKFAWLIGLFIVRSREDVPADEHTPAGGVVPSDKC